MRPIRADRIGADTQVIVKHITRTIRLQSGKTFQKTSKARFLVVQCGTCGKTIERRLKGYKPGVPSYCNYKCMWARNRGNDKPRTKKPLDPEQSVIPCEPHKSRRKINLRLARIVQITSPVECHSCKLVQPAMSVVIQDQYMSICEECYHVHVNE